MKNTEYKMKGKVYIYPSEAATWYFVGVPKEVGQKIRKKYSEFSKGFGSLPIEAKIGKTVWKTSIFPNKYSESYIMPLKALVRRNEDIEVGYEINFKIKILV